MITKQQASAVLDRPVFDPGGEKIGSAKHVFYDDATGRPEWVTVKTGMFGSNESFIPIHDATMVQDHLEVPYAKEQVKDAPNVDVDGGGHLSAQEEHRLYEYYGLATGGGDTGTGRDTAASDSGRAEGYGAAGAAGAGGAAGVAAAGTARNRTAPAEPVAARDTTAASATGRTKGLDDAAMTRSEEHMHVGTERHEVGTARLRKYVVTEEEQQTVPVRHEEVRVVREPITEANRKSALAGDDIAEAEHTVTLHEERAVVEMRTEPVERVRLVTEEKVEQKTVTGTVRKERIEADTSAEAEAAKQDALPGDDPLRGRSNRHT